MDLSTAHLRRAFRQRARGFQGIEQLVQAVERPHALGDHDIDHHQNADAAAHSVWLLRGLNVAQIPRADVVMGLLAPKLLLDVFAQLRQRREAMTTAAVVVDVERIDVYEAFALKVDKGELELELMQFHMAQKPVLRGEVGCACVAKRRDRSFRGSSAQPPAP